MNPKKISWREPQPAFLAGLKKDEERRHLSAADRNLEECFHLPRGSGQTEDRTALSKCYFQKSRCVSSWIMNNAWRRFAVQLRNGLLPPGFWCCRSLFFSFVSDVTAGTLGRSDTSKWARLRNKASTWSVHFQRWSDSWCYYLAFRKKTAAGKKWALSVSQAVSWEWMDPLCRQHTQKKKRSGCRIHLCISNHSGRTKHS